MFIPAGTFLMGSLENELHRLDREVPQHEVTLSQFFLAKYPVTQSQWQVVAAMPQVNRQIEPDPSYFKGDLMPVEQVSWHDVVEFCDRLTVHTNRQYRLPTEAEWEYACRAGTTTPFHFGKTISTEHANYRGVDRESNGVLFKGNYGDGPNGNFLEKTTPVNFFGISNAFGLCDIHGNVWEWCQDHWHDSYNFKTPTDGSAWLSDDGTAMRIRRGGSWSTNPQNCRSAYRGKSDPQESVYCFGFRVCCSATRRKL
ncbi:MAG: formylglycine-generating enzyme family protein [Crinalium sp.]